MTTEYINELGLIVTHSNDLSISFCQIHYLNYLYGILPNTYLYIIPSLIKTHNWLRLFVMKSKIIFHLGIFLFTVVTTPILYYFFVKLKTHISGLFSGTNGQNIRILALRIQQAVQNGTTFRVSYNNVEILTYPHRQILFIQYFFLLNHQQVERDYESFLYNRAFFLQLNLID